MAKVAAAWLDAVAICKQTKKSPTISTRHKAQKNEQVQKKRILSGLPLFLPIIYQRSDASWRMHQSIPDALAHTVQSCRCVCRRSSSLTDSNQRGERITNRLNPYCGCQLASTCHFSSQRWTQLLETKPISYCQRKNKKKLLQTYFGLVLKSRNPIFRALFSKSRHALLGKK